MNPVDLTLDQYIRIAEFAKLAWIIHGGDDNEKLATVKLAKRDSPDFCAESTHEDARFAFHQALKAAGVPVMP